MEPRLEILTHPLTRDQMLAELGFLADHLRGPSQPDCEVLFGFAWGNEYYSSDRWEYERVPFESLVPRVMEVEQAGFGRIGRDNLYVRIPGRTLEFRFCDDSDIHLAYDAADDVTEFFYQRWNLLGFSPAEWDIVAKERLRFG